MSDQFIVENASPTLAGLKTGNLFSAEYSNRQQINDEIRQLNYILTRKGLRAVPVRYMKHRVLIYLYRPEYLGRDIQKEDVAQILREKGYSLTSPDRCLAELISHMNRCGEGESFPHEIGLFLGYPAEDVRGFMNDTRKNVRAVGYWKVYGDRRAAENTFQKYRKCTDMYCRQLQKGKTLDQLIVRTSGIIKHSSS